MNYMMPDSWNDRRQFLVMELHINKKLTPEEWLEYHFLDNIAEAVVNYAGRGMFEDERQPRPMCKGDGNGSCSAHPDGCEVQERDYQKTYRENWKSLVELSDGSLNKDQVARELSDYSMVMRIASVVYGHITGNIVSKPNTHSGVIICLADEQTQKLVNEATEDMRKEAKPIIKQLRDLVNDTTGECTNFKRGPEGGCVCLTCSVSDLETVMKE